VKLVDIGRQNFPLLKIRMFLLDRSADVLQLIYVLFSREKASFDFEVKKLAFVNGYKGRYAETIFCFSLVKSHYMVTTFDHICQRLC
jgi:hypothetical protein